MISGYSRENPEATAPELVQNIGELLRAARMGAVRFEIRPGGGQEFVLQEGVQEVGRGVVRKVAGVAEGDRRSVVMCAARGLREQRGV